MSFRNPCHMPFCNFIPPFTLTEGSASGIKIIREKTQDNFLVDFPSAEIRGKRQIKFCALQTTGFLQRQIAVKLEIAPRLQHESH